MRRLICSLLLFAFIAHGGTLTITTWNLEWFPGGPRDKREPVSEAKAIQDVAELMRRLDSDVFVIQEIRDIEACEQLVAALKPKSYSVAVCSKFREAFGGTIGVQQIAIISRLPCSKAWFENWKTTGYADPPRGFSFAEIQVGSKRVGVYGLHLKSNLSRTNGERDRQLNILKRELAAEQVIAHVEVMKVSTNSIDTFIIAGDFNTTLDQPEFASEETLTKFRENGFTSGTENTPLSERVTIPGKGRYPDATFDYIFAKGFINSDVLPTITRSSLSDHYPATRIFRLP